MSQRLVGPVLLALALAACGSSGSDGLSSASATSNDTSSDPAGETSETVTETEQPAPSELLLSGLSMVPDIDGETIWFDGTNYERAFELTGLAVPDPDDAVAVEQLIQATIDLPSQASAFATVLSDPRAASSEIGFSFTETRLAIATSGSVATLESVFVTDVEDWTGRAVDPTTTLLDGPVAVIARGPADPAVFLASVTSAKADGTSLADNADVVDSLAILEAHDAYRFTYGNRASEPFDPSIVVAAPALVPYSSFATGIALEDGSHVNILVLGHGDAEVAQANADLLRSVLDNGSAAQGGEPWTDVFEVRSIEVVGRFAVAVLQPVSRPAALDEVIVMGDSLLWSTTS